MLGIDGGEGIRALVIVLLKMIGSSEGPMDWSRFRELVRLKSMF